MGPHILKGHGSIRYAKLPFFRRSTSAYFASNSENSNFLRPLNHTWSIHTQMELLRFFSLSWYNWIFQFAESCGWFAGGRSLLHSSIFQPPQLHFLNRERYWLAYWFSNKPSSQNAENPIKKLNSKQLIQSRRWNVLISALKINKVHTAPFARTFSFLLKNEAAAEAASLAHTKNKEILHKYFIYIN